MPDGTVSVVIPTYGRPHLVIRAVRAAMDDPAVGEVLVVLDGFDAQTHSRLDSLRRSDERVRIIVQECNRGQGPARTAGAMAANGEVLLFLDDDVIAAAGLAGGHRRAHQAADNLVVMGYMPTVPPTTRGRSAVATLVYGHGYEIACRRYRADPDAVLDHLWGGNFSVRRTAYLAVAGQLDRFPRLPGEDQDLGFRLRNAGLHGVFDPSLLAYHHHVRSWDAMLVEAARMGACDRALHALHPEVLGPLDIDETPAYLPAALRRLLRASDVGAVRDIELGVLRTAAGAADRLGARQTSRRCAFLATQVARRCGRRTLSWRESRLPFPELDMTAARSA